MLTFMLACAIYALVIGLEILKKNGMIFVPFVVIGIISAIVTFQSWYWRDAFYTTHLNALLIMLLTTFLLPILANVAGLRAVKDWLQGNTTKISDMTKTVITKGFIAICAVLSAIILVFLPGIAGGCFYYLGMFYYPTMNDAFMFIVNIMFIIQAIILLGLGYYFLSTTFRKLCAIGIIGMFVVYISGIIVGDNPILYFILSLIFFILLKLIVLGLMLIAGIIFCLVMYIIPSAIVINDLNATEAIKKSLRFAKDNTGSFSFLVIVNIPSFIILVYSLQHQPPLDPSVLAIAPSIMLILVDTLASPYILSFFAFIYAHSLKDECPHIYSIKDD